MDDPARFRKRFLQFTLVFAAACGWLFSGWPQILNFPPQIRQAYADSTGALVAGANAAKASGAGDNNGFETTPGNADGSDDNAYAVSTNTGTGNATDGCGTFNQAEDDAHDYYNFGIAPPAGSTIDGIQVDTIAKWSTNSGTNQLCVELSWDGGATWTSTANTTGDIQTSESADILGSAIDTWGRTWTVSELNNTNFRVRVMIDPDRSDTTTASLELLTVTVTYTLPPTFEQSAYRFFTNANSTDVGSALALQDTAATLSSAGDAFRLRTLLHVGVSDLGVSGQNFKLQFAERSGTCDTGFSGESYADVTGATVIAYNNNATPVDGDNLTANASDPTHSGDTIVNQDYEEANNFTNTVATIAVGQDGKWDFSLIDNGAVANTAYCFRVVKSDGSVLDTYTQIPQITTAAAASLTFVVSTQNFSTITPGSPVFATSTLSVDTDNTTGWNVTVVRDDADTTMDLDSNAGVNITDQTAWTPGAATTTAGNAVRIGSFSNSGDVLAFRVMSASGTIAFRAPTWWGSADTYTDNANTLWAGFPSTAKKVGESSVSSGGSPALSTVVYCLDVSETQQNGAYSGGITYTAIMNP